MTIPVALGAATTASTNTVEAKIAKMTRKKKSHPREVVVFSREKFYFWLSLPLIIALNTLGMFVGTLAIGTQRLSIFYDVMLIFALSLLPWWIFTVALWQRMGVDEEKVWYRYGWYYREVRFDEMLRFQTASPHNCLRVGRRHVYLHHKYFDYTLAHIRILEELQHRRFQIDSIEVDSPGWERMAASFGDNLIIMILAEHKEFYYANPEEEAYIRSLRIVPQTRRRRRLSI